MVCWCFGGVLLREEGRVEVQRAPGPEGLGFRV